MGDEHKEMERRPDIDTGKRGQRAGIGADEFDRAPRETAGNHPGRDQGYLSNWVSRFSSFQESQRVKVDSSSGSLRSA